MSSKRDYKKYNYNYYKKHKEKELCRAKQYRDEHRETININAKIRYHTRKGYDYELRKNYGITIDDYNKMFEEQNGCCKLCGRHQSEQKFRLCVDHNHETGRVRGLLCTRCNVGLGYYERFSLKIITYLGKYYGT